MLGRRYVDLTSPGTELRIKSKTDDHFETSVHFLQHWGGPSITNSVRRDPSARRSSHSPREQALIILLLTTCADLFGQSKYARFVDPDKQGEKQTINKGDGGSEDVIYLGTIQEKEGRVTYHVFAVFRLVQAAVVKHGHSEVVFLDNSLEMIRTYRLGLPEELPFLLKDNSLSFYYTDDRTKGRKTFRSEISGLLPELLSVSPYSCY